MDPVISARLLRMANDKTYGFACDCASLELALQRLGGRAAEQVDELFVAGQIYNVGNRRRIQSHLGRLWRHSTQVASICRHLAPGCALEPGIAMVAGLLHDIGAVPALVFAERIPRLLSQREVLNPLMETVHCQVSAAILDAWGLPQALVAAAAHHEDLERHTPGSPDYVDLVMLANLLSHQGTDHKYSCVDLTREPAADKLQIAASDIADLLAGAKTIEATFWDY